MNKLFTIIFSISFFITSTLHGDDSGLIERLEKIEANNKIMVQMVQRVTDLEKKQKMLQGALSQSILVSPVACSKLPGSWKEAAVGAGRFLLGKSNVYKPLTQGGRPTVKLTTDHLPSHGHRVSTNRNENVHDGLGGSGKSYGILRNFTIIPDRQGWDAVLPNILEKTGGSQPHENMPPYIAVYFCQMKK